MIPTLRNALPLFVLLAIPAAATAAQAGDAAALLPVGAAAPDVTGKDAAGAPVKLSAQKGKFSVVYFYPKDETAGCTKEACAFRDSSDKFARAGVTIFAVSRDPDASHAAFREHYKLPFPMVADPAGSVQHAYHVPSVKPGVDLTARVTFLVGPDGKIARVWPKVDPVVSASQVLDAVAELQNKHKQ
ncbi:MAG TPA: peroxiredoxin [Polyangia bacterium]|nr:peroxiredoxin [Polyangia bacterium]